MQWHVSHHDDLGDPFDVVNTPNKFSLARNDLADFGHMNKNLFVFGASPAGTRSDLGAAKQRPEHLDMSLLADSEENGFVLGTVGPGRFVMEMTPAAASSQMESKDFLSVDVLEESSKVDFLIQIIWNYYENFKLLRRISNYFKLFRIISNYLEII
jgi:hypothetical protein